MSLTQFYERIPDGSNARPLPQYVNARAAVTTSEQISVPDGARYVVLDAALPFHLNFGANPTAAVPTDTDDGTANILINPNAPIESRTFIVQGIAKLAVAAASATMVTATFYK